MRISDWSSDVCSSDLIAQGAIAAIRQGQFNPTTARIVFDLARPTIISDGQFTPDGKTLTLSLEDADAADFAAALRRGRSAFDPPSANAARPPAQTHGITVAIPPPAKAIGLPKVAGPGDDNKIGRASWRERGGKYV